MAQVWRDIREEAVLDFYAVVKGSPIILLIVNINYRRKRDDVGMIFINQGKETQWEGGMQVPAAI